MQLVKTFCREDDDSINRINLMLSGKSSWTTAFTHQVTPLPNHCWHTLPWTSAGKKHKRGWMTKPDLNTVCCNVNSLYIAANNLEYKKLMCYLISSMSSAVIKSNLDISFLLLHSSTSLTQRPIMFNAGMQMCKDYFLWKDSSQGHGRYPEIWQSNDFTACVLQFPTTLSILLCFIWTTN